jgi:hypothetical protein
MAESRGRAGFASPKLGARAEPVTDLPKLSSDVNACEVGAVSQEMLTPHECGHGGTARLGQTIVSNQLRWYRSISCPSCGHIEEDGVGVPPKELRDRLLKEGGRWKLVANGPHKAAPIKVVRSALGLSGEAASAFRLFPVLYIGTKTEAEWLKARMDASNLASQIVESVEV